MACAPQFKEKCKCKTFGQQKIVFRLLTDLFLDK